jgi:hypothetical protein
MEHDMSKIRLWIAGLVAFLMAFPLTTRAFAQDPGFTPFGVSFDSEGS